MAVDLKQNLDLIDYFGPIVVWLAFFAIVFLISITCILYCCVSKDDDETVFAKYGWGVQKRQPLVPTLDAESNKLN